MAFAESAEEAVAKRFVHTIPDEVTVEPLSPPNPWSRVSVDGFQVHFPGAPTTMWVPSTTPDEPAWKALVYVEGDVDAPIFYQAMWRRLTSPPAEEAQSAFLHSVRGKIFNEQRSKIIDEQPLKKNTLRGLDATFETTAPNNKTLYVRAHILLIGDLLIVLTTFRDLDTPDAMKHRKSTDEFFTSFGLISE